MRALRLIMMPAVLLPAMLSLPLSTPPSLAADAPEVRLEPKVSPLSSIEFTGRIRIHNKLVTFDAPPDYRESFSYWADRMTGTLKEEKIEFITVTRETAADGIVPFRRQAPRYELEVSKRGENPSVLPRHIRRSVTSRVWEGTFDRYGNVLSMDEVAGEDEDSETIKDLSFPFLDNLYPPLDGPKKLAIGAAFTTRTKADLPTRLTVSGLENLGLILVRTYTLKEIRPDKADFDVTVAFESDPERPAQREKTTCAISGSGGGTATFDLKNGVFSASTLSSSLIFEIKAPLRKLPSQAEDFDPGLGTSRIELQLQMSGDRAVTQLMGESEAPAPAPAAD